MLGEARAAAFFALVPLVSGASAEQAELKQGADFYQDGIHYREVYFGNVVYRLPVTKYSIGISPYNVTRDHASFGFSLILPDLSRLSSDPTEVATWGKGTGWHRELHILVEYGRDFISQQKKLDWAFDSSEQLKDADYQHNLASHPEIVNNSKFLDKSVYGTMPDGCKKYVGESLAGDVLKVCNFNGYKEDIFLVECSTGEAHFFSVPMAAFPKL